MMKKFLLALSLLFYKLSIRAYHLLIIISSVKNQKAKKWIKGRKNIFDKIKSGFYEKPIWFHVSSLGEFEQARPIIEQLKKNKSTQQIVLTFFSPSGYEIRKNYENADYIFYLPLDTYKNAQKFLEIINPTIAIFMKYDFWYYYISALYKNKIPLILVSALFNKKQPFFMWYGLLHREMLHKINMIFVQNKESKSLLNNIGISDVQTITDTRIDRAFNIATEASQKKYQAIENFINDKLVILGGSTHETEIDYISEYCKESAADIKFIIAPHNTDEKSVNSILSKFENPVLWEKITNETDLRNSKVLIINVIGILAYLYQYSDIVFIGGGFSTGIHNILEPATFGKPIFFGKKNYHKFNEAINLVQSGGAAIVNSYEDFVSQIEILKQADERKRRGQICRLYIENNTGGTKKVVDYIHNYL
jgi:3-deoxy-D-manno-octulosonic-acid transferase